MKDLLFHYGITLGKRYTRRQKTWFLEEAAKEADKQGWTWHIAKAQLKYGKSAHLVIGDPGHAKLVVLAAYDTPGKMWIPHFIDTPFNARRNFRCDTLNLVLQYATGAVLMFGVYFLMKDFMTSSVLLRIVISSLSTLLLISVFKLWTGIANPINQNRNSASIALMLDLLKEPSLKGKLSVIFVDHGIQGVTGFKQIKEMDLIPAATPVVLLDSLASGETLLLAHGSANGDLANDLIKAIKTPVYDKVYSDEGTLNHAFGLFDKGMFILSGNIENKAFKRYDTRSRKDFKVDQPRLEDLRRGLLTFTGRGEHNDHRL
jgi:hypothetical protein